LVCALADVVGQLEAPSKQELTRKLKAANQKVNELLESKMRRYQLDINAEMMRQREQLRKVLIDIVQPLLNMITEDGGRALNIKFKEEQLSLPTIDFESFEAEIGEKMKQMVKEKRETVNRTREETVEKHGACGARRSETHNVQYQEEETTGFKISPDNLKSCWRAKIDDLIGGSQKSTELLIQQEVIGEVEKIQIEVTSRCDEFIQIIQVQVDQKHAQCTSHSNSSVKLKESLDKINNALNGVVQLKAAMMEMNNLDAGKYCGFHLIEKIQAESKND